MSTKALGNDPVVILCPHCLAENEEHAHFCRECFTPLSAHAAIDPVGQIYAQGDTYRKAVANPSRPIILLGMWLIFAPSIFLALLGLIAIFEPHRVGNPVALAILYAGFYTGLALVQGAILYRVTHNFLHRKTIAATLGSHTG